MIRSSKSMKALFIVTGRGIGGDAVTALNIARALENYGVECEFALDHSAPGLLFKNMAWTGIRSAYPRQVAMPPPNSPWPKRPSKHLKPPGKRPSYAGK